MSASPDYSQGAAFVRGRYVPMADAAIPITDWGFLRSDATYDVVTVWEGAFFRLDAHLERFGRSCESFGLTPGLEDRQITAVLAQCVRLSGLRRAYVEMICTRGQPPWGSRDPREAVNQFYAFAVPYVWIANEAQRAGGMNLMLSAVQRIPGTSVDPRAKNYHWNDLTMGLLGALDAGGDTVVLTDDQGNAVEGPGFNLFCVTANGALVTPALGVPEGITRRTVLEIAQAAGFATELRAIPVEELRRAREVFVSSSAGGVIPVTRVDGQPVGDGTVGAVTQQIRQTYWDWHQDARYRLAIDYDGCSGDK